MAKLEKETKPAAEAKLSAPPAPAPKASQTKTAEVKESEKLQKEGWVVVGVTKKDGVKVHILEKE